MEHLTQRLEQLKQQESALIMQLDELRVLINAYENTIQEKTTETTE